MTARKKTTDKAQKAFPPDYFRDFTRSKEEDRTTPGPVPEQEEASITSAIMDLDQSLCILESALASLLAKLTPVRKFGPVATGNDLGASPSGSSVRCNIMCAVDKVRILTNNVLEIRDDLDLNN